MVDDLLEVAERVLGIGVEELHAGHMALRAVVVFLAALALVRLGNKRFLGRATAFDLVVAFLLGSVLSRAITGNAPFVPALSAGAVLVAMHWLLSAVAFRSDRLGGILKGQPRELVRDGTVRWEEMRGGQITRNDVDEALRLQGHPPNLARVRSAHLERNGEISVVARSEPRRVDVAVEEGVKAVRVELA